MALSPLFHRALFEVISSPLFHRALFEVIEITRNIEITFDVKNDLERFLG